MHKFVFNLAKQNTGDIVLALPYIQAMKNEGYEVQLYVPERSLSPIKCLLKLENTRLPPKGYYAINPVGRGHMTDRWKKALESRGIKLQPKRSFSVDYTQSNTVLLNPWCYMESKLVPARLWEAACEVLQDKGYKVRVAGPESIHTLGEYLAKKYGVENYVGQDKGRWVETVRESRLVITPDSGAGHVADMFGIPTVVIFMSTSPEVWSPFWDASGCITRPSTLQLKQLIHKRIT